MATAPPWPPQEPPYQADHPSHQSATAAYNNPHQPATLAYNNYKWSTGLCHCFDDPANCLITCICPCITFGQIAEIVNRGRPICAVSGSLYGLLLGFTGMACLYSCFYRSRLRARFGLEEAPCADCLVHFCCETCALCQEYREIRSRGFDMGLGWEGNIEKNNQRGMQQPPIMMGMNR